MLLDGPLCHLESPTCPENAGSHGASGHREGDPAEDLRGVVRARDVVEQEATWDDVLL